MNLSFSPASDFSLEDLCNLLNQGFAGYMVPVHFTVPTLLSTLIRDSIDLNVSRIVEHDGASIGVALVAKRGWHARLAAMGIITEYRGQRVGQRLLNQLSSDLTLEGIREMVLEVLESNRLGITLYHRAGFTPIRRLISLQHNGERLDTDANLAPLPAPHFSSTDLEPIEITEVARRLIAHPLAELPWQLSGTSLMVASPPAIAYRLDRAAIVLSDPTEPTIWIRTVVVDPDARHRGQAKAILASVMDKYRNKRWSVPALCPEEITPLFERLGFQPGDLTQLQMQKSL